MSYSAHIFIKLAGTLFLLILFVPTATAQQRAVATPSVFNTTSTAFGSFLDSEPPQPPPTPQEIIASFIQTEAQVREALSQHTFKRDVVLQTIDPEGKVSGEYIRNSQFVFDDKGNRIERVLYHPPSTIRQMRITKEDIQDLAGAQLLGVDITETGKYRLTYAGTDKFDARAVFAIDVSPMQAPNAHRMKERFFVGRIWVDATSFRLLKVKGVVEPQGKQRFPVFQSWREAVTEGLWFPTRTEVDDVLRFPHMEVHYRVKVRYHAYKRFASKVTITEISEPLGQ